MHPFLFMFAFIFPENSVQGELVFPTGGCLLLFSASVPFLSACFLSAPSSFEAVTDTVRGRCPLDRLLSWEQPAPCPLSISGASAPLPSGQSQPLLRPVRVQGTGETRTPPQFPLQGWGQSRAGPPPPVWGGRHARRGPEGAWCAWRSWGRERRRLGVASPVGPCEPDPVLSHGRRSRRPRSSKPHVW